MELLAHDTASGQNGASHSPAPLEETTEFGGGSGKDSSDDKYQFNCMLEKRLLKKLQGRRTIVLWLVICVDVMY